MSSIAADVLLLVLDPTTGQPLVDFAHVQYMLAGGVLAELALAERIRVEEIAPPQPEGRVRVIDSTPVGSAVLDMVLRDLADDKPRRPEAVIRRVARPVRDQVVDELVDEGIAQRRHGVLHGLSRREEWPEVARDHDATLRAAAVGPDIASSALSARDRAVLAVVQAGGALAAIDPSHVPVASSPTPGPWHAAAIDAGDAATMNALLVAVTAACESGTTRP